MSNSFHQITLDIQSSLLLSVSTPLGLFRLKFLPEGVGLASGILQAIVRKIFADLDDWIIVIFDNFLILADSYKDATTKLTTVLQRCHDNRLVLKMKKSWIGTNVVTFFGYEVKPGSWGRKAAKTLFLLCSFQVPRSRCRVSSVQQTSSTPIFLIMLNGPPHCTNVLLLVSTGHHLLGSKITRPSLTSSSHPYRRQLLFISLIIIYHGLSALMPLIVLWVLYCTTVARLTMVSLRAV